MKHSFLFMTKSKAKLVFTEISKKASLARGFYLSIHHNHSNEAIAFLMISMASRSSASVMTKGGAKRMMC